VSGFFEVVEEESGGAADGERRDGRKGPDAEAYQAAGVAAQPAGADAAPPQQGAAGYANPAVAVEKFAQVMHQWEQTRTASHDLTVRLAVGKEESLVVGMKESGQSVTVEVRASNQGMIDLLQSEKDSIIRHLEAQDIQTNIVIDPNASGTRERGDRQETGQRRPASDGPRAKADFGSFLDVFA
jgi:hypothetical protein